MYQHLFVWLFNDYQQQQSARNDFLESDPIFRITLYFSAMADGGSALYQNYLFPENKYDTFTIFRAGNNLLYTAHQFLASFFLYKMGNEGVCRILFLVYGKRFLVLC